MKSTPSTSTRTRTDREALLDQAILDRTGHGLWAEVDAIRASAPGWGWDRVAAELYRRHSVSVTGASLRKWNARRGKAAA